MPSNATGQEVPIVARDSRELAAVVGARVVEQTTAALGGLRQRLKERTVWHVNSTPRGGGVAELLQALLAYTVGAGISARWVAVRGDAAFFSITKRLHHALHGATGDGSALGGDERRHYEAVLEANARAFVERVRPGDIAVLHDPQTAGLADVLLARRCTVVWRCHVGHDEQNRETRRAWSFLRGYVQRAHAHVFHRHAYVPGFLARSGRDRVHVIPPSIDPLSAKNRPLAPRRVSAILAHAGLIDAPASEPEFERANGTRGAVERRARIVRDGPPPSTDTDLVVQVSRWDELKDPLGVMQGFLAMRDGRPGGPPHLVLAGPDPFAVRDDPEAAAVFERVSSYRSSLPSEVRARIHLANLPMEDPEENAAIVNALQSHATVVVQKSVREGFGLTVAEAMLKGRAVVASAVGGIKDQIEHGRSGLLLRDPADLDAFAAALDRVLGDRKLAHRLGHAAQRRVVEHFLCNRHLGQYLRLLETLDGGRAHGARHSSIGSQD